MRRDEARISSAVASVAHAAEIVEAAVSGIFGTLDGGGYPGPAIGGAGMIDPYDVVLTTERPMAFRGLRSGNAQPVRESERALAHVTVLRELGVLTWVGFVFKDRQLRIAVSRRSRESLARMADELRENRSTGV